MNYDAPLKAEMALSPVMMRTLFILIMFAIHCVGDLCSPIARNRCCDPQVANIKYLRSIFPCPCSNLQCVCNCVSYILSFQGNGKRYIKNDIYEDDSACPPVDYKCKKVRGARDLDWIKLESGNSFQGII